MISVIIYAFISVAGLTLVKMGSNAPLALSVGQAGFSFSTGWTTLLGLVLYVVSFLIYMTLIAKNNLTYIMPVCTALVYILTMFVSIIVLRERIGSMEWIGCCFILVGVVLMNVKK